ncbi:hypothetical protein HanRHA438_Chr00c35g0855841 [Helianthus annuus]|nr:hypothetical protein HanHA300_Chr15g0564271 [Helianthus annuus]KAJ0455566.1 hypothetical protein HanIR_Chr15g0752621 [Helianthus annuus]KAJ0473019.1 hypothetical protein HanHA89_Chr15g0613571 [Helianthus annuus]KAJ0515609.1 hypothetical protein HanHA300_Chr10g0382351 [Helianthus annuus]KAJ0524174.1 hypothetical protein HanIR_Chr10g0501671 [Helianthus annuus]
MAVCSTIYRTNPTRHPPTTVALGFCRQSGLLGFGQMNLVVHMFHMFDSGRVGVTLRRQKLTWRCEDFWRDD